MRRRNGLHFVLAVALAVGLARADEASHVRAVNDLFKVFQVEKYYQNISDMTVDNLVRMQPSLSEKKKEITTFVQSFLSWKSIEPEITEIYKEAFSEAELRELIGFYQTPIGKKVLKVLPELSQKGMDLAQRRLTQNMTKLQEFAKKAGKPSSAKTDNK